MNEVYDVFRLILDNPSNPKAYDKLAEFYESRQQHNEATAIRKLIEKRFYKNEQPDGPNSG